MFDTHNAEKEPHSAVVEQYFPYIRHVHVNEMDGRHPGTGSYDFGSLLNTLRRLNYQRWISVEVFDFSPGGDAIATESLRVLRSSAEILH